MVEGVNNNNSNAGMYALGAGVLGAGAGVTTAYLTKPYLKNGEPTDAFIKKFSDNIIDLLPESDEKNEFMKMKKAAAAIKKAKSFEELKEVCVHYGSEYKDMDIKDILKELDIECEGKDFKEIKKTITAKLNKIETGGGKEVFEMFWDAEKKSFIKLEENADAKLKEAAAVVKKAAKSIQGKYALIYGSIAAAVLAAGTYLATMGKKPAEAIPAEKVDVQA
ncbi:hypothetical protein IKR55_04095 [bacterium]|nr:hypothetical protein [bacterium]